jgi:hypothetical protein
MALSIRPPGSERLARFGIRRAAVDLAGILESALSRGLLSTFKPDLEQVEQIVGYDRLPIALNITRPADDRRAASCAAAFSSNPPFLS